MSFCKNCGKEIDSSFCPYCGTKVDEEVKQVENNFQNNLINNMFNMINQFNELAKAGEKMQEEGRQFMTDDEMDIVKNLYQNSANIMKQNEESDKQIKEYKLKLREARRAIASGHCPECGAKINKNDDFCPNCGADCLMEAYSDL